MNFDLSETGTLVRLLKRSSSARLNGPGRPGAGGDKLAIRRMIPTGMEKKPFFGGGIDNGRDPSPITQYAAGLTERAQGSEEPNFPLRSAWATRSSRENPIARPDIDCSWTRLRAKVTRRKRCEFMRNSAGVCAMTSGFRLVQNRRSCQGNFFARVTHDRD